MDDLAEKETSRPFSLHPNPHTSSSSSSRPPVLPFPQPPRARPVIRRKGRVLRRRSGSANRNGNQSPHDAEQDFEIAFAAGAFRNSLAAEQGQNTEEPQNEYEEEEYNLVPQFPGQSDEELQMELDYEQLSRESRLHSDSRGSGYVDELAEEELEKELLLEAQIRREQEEEELIDLKEADDDVVEEALHTAEKKFDIGSKTWIDIDSPTTQEKIEEDNKVSVDLWL